MQHTSIESVTYMFVTRVCSGFYWYVPTLPRALYALGIVCIYQSNPLLLCYNLLLSTIVLNSMDLHGIYGFPCQPYNNISFKYWLFIYWYEATGTINPFKQPKCALELKLLNFKNFVNCKHFVCLPAWPQQLTYSLNYWAFGLHSFWHTW